MKAMTARAQDGRLILDEPTNLPDGATVQVEMIDGDDLDDEERKQLHESLEIGEREADAGKGMSVQALWDLLLAR